MIATVLSDNRTPDPERFGTEHGLAVLLQTPSLQILLDTGASGLFIRNAERSGLDLQAVDYVFLSHGHADHTGGLGAFLDINLKARIIVSPNAVSGLFFSRRGGLHNISCRWPLTQMTGRTEFVGATQTLPGGIRVIAHIPQKHALPLGDRHLFIERDGELFPDDFRHEMALYIDGLLFTGCAHNGLENILEASPWPVHTVLGGFHLLDAKGEDVYEDEKTLTALAGRLTERYPRTTFYTSHCTGDGAFRTLQSVLGPRLQQFSCGTQIRIPMLPEA